MASAHPDLLTDAPQLNITNVIAVNGGRVMWIMRILNIPRPKPMIPSMPCSTTMPAISSCVSARAKPANRPVSQSRCTVNNVDGKGASWGTHENYMMLRSVPFDQVAKLMTAHFVARQIFTGAGRVGIGERSETAGYQLSQRATIFI